MEKISANFCTNYRITGLIPDVTNWFWWRRRCLLIRVTATTTATTTTTSNTSRIFSRHDLFPLLDNIVHNDNFSTFQKNLLLAEEWYAKKKDIIDMWNKLSPNQQILMNPIPVGHKGTRFDNDGLRITGSPAFIAAILGRVKDLLKYHALPGLTLDVEYKQVTPKDQEAAREPKYVAYIYLTRTNKHR